MHITGETVTELDVAQLRRRLRASTAPALLAARARAEPDRVALRAQRLGVFREVSWREYAERVARTMAVFSTLGVSRGDRVAIIGDACEEWVYCDLAAQALGAITYGIYQTSSPAEAQYQMRDGGAKLLVAENQEFVDKVLPFARELPNLQAIVVVDDTALYDYDDPLLRSLPELVAAVDLKGDAAVLHLEDAATAIDPASPAFIVYTSGTTGPPKGALIAHGKHLAAAHTLVSHYPTLAEKPHRTVAYLPLCHVLGRDVAITVPLLSSLVPHFGEDPEAIGTTIHEVAPTVLFAVPRFLQKYASQVMIGLAGTTPAKRAVHDAAMRFGRDHARRRWDGANGRFQDFVYRLWHGIAFRPVLNKLGFDAIELLISGGAPLPPATMTLWQIYGVNLVEMYGQTETAGAIIAGQRGPFPRPGGVCEPADGVQVRIADDGEVLVRCDDVFDGYWNQPDATAAVLGADGWLRTGDVGRLDEHGRLQLVDRARDFIVTSGGKSISPTYIESAVRASPYVADVCVFGDRRKYLTALIEIDFDTVSDWAQSRGLAYAGFTSLASHSSVVELIAGEIERANAELGRVEQIKQFRILPKALDPEEEGEPVTPTRKIKRRQMQQRFADLIEQMYAADDDEQRIAAGIASGDPR
ncbi:MAG TPA: AMP-binding protein [Burkholderiaceae bacterium]|nr:AMP-binding protein [Burkholderiaceae bacterium]